MRRWGVLHVYAVICTIFCMMLLINLFSSPTTTTTTVTTSSGALSAIVTRHESTHLGVGAPKASVRVAQPPATVSRVLHHSPTHAYTHSFIVINDIHVDSDFIASKYKRSEGICRGPGETTCGKQHDSSSDSSTSRSSSAIVEGKKSADESAFPYGRHGCDPPVLLLDSMLAAIGNLYDPNARTSSPYSKKYTQLDFVVFLGDAAPHFAKCWRAVFTSVKLVASSIAHAVSKQWKLHQPARPPVFPALGNNDVFPAFYLSTSQVTELCELYHELGWLSAKDGHQQWNGRSSKSSFCFGGYYSRLLDGESTPIRIVTLNSVAWSVWLKEKPDGESHASGTLKGCNVAEGLRAKDPFDQFLWLNGTLSAARRNKERVYVLGHIPPGDKRDRPKAGNLCPAYEKRLEEILAEYHEVIVTGLFADHHIDEFRAVWSAHGSTKKEKKYGDVRGSNMDGAPSSHRLRMRQRAEVSRDLHANSSPVMSLFVHPAMTPRKFSNPAFRRYFFEKDRASGLYDYEQFYFPLQHANREGETSAAVSWRHLYAFKEAYGVHGDQITAASLQDVMYRLAKDPELMTKYQTFASAGYISSYDESVFLCDIRYLNELDNNKCVANGIFV